jgi:hypothetical protein
MSKANEIYNLARIVEAGDFKEGDNVKFKEGHQLAGTVGRVAGINPDGTLQIKVGQALQDSVNPSDLELVDYGAQNKVGGEQEPDAPADQSVSQNADPASP